MQKKYYELFFKVEERYKTLFLEFVFDLGVQAIEEKDGGIYIRSNDSLEELSWALDLFSQKLSDLKNENIILTHTLVEKENKNWIEEYKKGIKPILIDDIYIHTTWQDPKENCLNIKIDPALAFGSGHHESTHSCIRFIRKYAKFNLKALDIGCGSGVLSIIMSKLGCKVDACDTDELAVQSTQDNAQINEVELEQVWHGSVDKCSSKYNLIVANIIADVILILERDIKKHLDDNAILILSGILDKYRNRIEEKFQDLELIDSIQVNEWVSLVYKKKGKNE